jgi:hypothetical protein
MKRIVIVTCILALAGCKMLGKNDAAGDAAATVTSATAPSDSAAPADSTAANSPHAGPAAQPGVVTDPNASPNVEQNDTQAQAEINKGNYKKEMESLEKEDLTADKK